jgi:hypothetical protein
VANDEGAVAAAVPEAVSRVGAVVVVFCTAVPVTVVVAESVTVAEDRPVRAALAAAVTQFAPVKKQRAVTSPTFRAKISPGAALNGGNMRGSSLITSLICKFRCGKLTPIPTFPLG